MRAPQKPVWSEYRAVPRHMGAAAHERSIRDVQNIPRPMIGEPATIRETSVRERCDHGLGITHAIDISTNPKPFGRTKQECFEFGGSFLVTPITNPNAFRVRRLAWARVEQAGIGCFVPGPDSPCPALSFVNSCKHRTECKHAIISVEIENGAWRPAE